MLLGMTERLDDFRRGALRPRAPAALQRFERRSGFGRRGGARDLFLLDAELD